MFEFAFINVYVCLYISMYVDICLYSVYLYACECLCLFVSPIIICYLCVTSNVSGRSVYKYFTSATTIFPINL